MIRSDLGHLNCPFYEEKLDNGLRILLYPRKTKETSAVIYINQGGYPHDEEINSSKMPFGVAYLLEKMVMSDKTVDQLLQASTIGRSHTDFSYTLFQLDTLGDVFAPLKIVMDKIANIDFTEADVDEFKRQYLVAKDENPFTPSIKGLLNNMYFNSPIRNGYQPTYEESVLIHASAMKKFLLRYYIAKEMTIMVSGDMTPSQFKEGLSKLRIPGNITTYNKELKFEEDYSKVKDTYSTGRFEVRESTLSFGIKLPKREKLYENYGQLLFDIYEVVLPILYSENPEFLTGVRSTDSYLDGCSLIQGGEDTSIILTFKTKSSPNALVTFLTDYHADLTKHLNRDRFSDYVKFYYADSIRLLSSPKKALLCFAKAYANSVPYTAIVGQVSKLSFSNFKTFLKELSTYPRSAFFIK